MTPLLLAVTAIIAYSFGSLSTPILSSHIYFHENVLNYSRDNAGITRFLKRHGGKGVGVIVLIEAIKVIVPVLLGSLLMLIVDRVENRQRVCAFLRCPRHEFSDTLSLPR